jgi:U4/U6 small nuclear ribonucleoprotein PRP4
MTCVQTTQNIGSQIGDERPVSIVRFSPNSKLLATGSWTGLVKVWSVPDCKLKSTLRGRPNPCPLLTYLLITSSGHSDRVGGVSWHPKATVSQAPSSVNLASGAGDHNVHLWSLDRCAALLWLPASQLTRTPRLRYTIHSEAPISVLQGHRARVVRTVFHPSGDYVVTASFDGTWRLWDVETSKELLMQEGHAKEVFTVACQADGSLVASACVFLVLCEGYY